MTSPPPVEVVVVGYGFAGAQRHATAYARDGRCDVVAVVDPDPARRELAETRGHPAVAAVEELPAPSERPRIWSIATPPATHAELALAGLRAGAHVLVEKPLATRVADGERLVRAAAEAGRQLAVVHNFVHAGAVGQLAATVSREQLGRLTGLTAVQWSASTRALPAWIRAQPGGLLFDELPHHAYLLRHWLGGLTVHGSTRFERGTTQRLHALVGHGEVLATLDVWHGAPQTEWIYALGFERATAVIDLFRDVLTVLPPEGERTPRWIVEAPLRAQAGYARGMVRRGMARVAGGRSLYGTETVVRRLVDAVLGLGTPASDGAAGVQVLRDVIAMLGDGSTLPTPQPPPGR